MARRRKGCSERACFEAGFDRTAGGCWLWRSQGSVRYPAFYFRGTRLGVHVVSWLLYRGTLLPGQVVCHSCDVSRCVNPEHLFVGTQADNVRDMVGKGRHWAQSNSRAAELCRQRLGGRSFPGERNPAAKLTAPVVEELRSLRGCGYSLRDLACRFGVSKSQVARIVSGDSWVVAKALETVLLGSPP